MILLDPFHPAFPQARRDLALAALAGAERLPKSLAPDAYAQALHDADQLCRQHGGWRRYAHRCSPACLGCCRAQQRLLPRP